MYIYTYIYIYTYGWFKFLPSQSMDWYKENIYSKNTLIFHGEISMVSG